TIGDYKVHYEDKTTARIPILYGRDLRDWSDQDNARPVLRGVLAWQGTNDLLRQRGGKIRLYVTTWENPYPRKLVTHIDYQSANTVCSPFCIAMTAEGDGLTAPDREFYYDFRKGLPQASFKFFGPDALGQVKFEPAGLRISLLAERASTAPVGVAARFR